jgi:hypothetical protein
MLPRWPRPPQVPRGLLGVAGAKRKRGAGPRCAAPRPPIQFTSTMGPVYPDWSPYAVWLRSLAEVALPRRTPFCAVRARSILAFFPATRFALGHTGALGILLCSCRFCGGASRWAGRLRNGTLHSVRTQALWPRRSKVAFPPPHLHQTTELSAASNRSCGQFWSGSPGRLSKTRREAPEEIGRELSGYKDPNTSRDVACRLGSPGPCRV